MISVTVAAQGKSKRLVGGHLKAYGSGRLSIFDLAKATDSKPKPQEILVTLCFPYLCEFLNGSKYRADVEEGKRLAKKRDNQLTIVQYAAINKLEEEELALVLAFLDPYSLINCERVCKKWRHAIDSHLDLLPKFQKDQMRLLFDEGEVVIYPVDEKRCPCRHPMPSLQMLHRRLRHLTSLSLFVRGLIPVESTPVLKALANLSLCPQQIYLIWCKFDPSSGPLIAEFLAKNKECVVDLGLEECSPPSLITDSLLAPLLPSLTSLRVWNDGKSGAYGLTDTTIVSLAESVQKGAHLDSVDLASCSVSSHGVFSLIHAWHSTVPSDLSLSLNYCPRLHLDDLLSLLTSEGIYFSNGKIHRAGRSLILFV